jgi:transcription elongation factor Elf1
MSHRRFTCPVCGFPGLEEPPYDDTGAATFGICPCCGVEFGYDDAKRSHAELREQWIKAGMKWRQDKPPTGWDAKAQLRAAGFSN